MIVLVKSMTGFGRCEGKFDGMHITVEIKSVNHRYFDFNCRTSRGFGFLEEKAKSYIQSKITRGKTDAFISVIDEEETPCEVVLNKSLAEGYINALKDLKQTYSLEGEVTPGLVSRIPDVFTIRKEALDEERIWNGVKQALDNALESLLAMRLSEGSRMKADVLSKAQNIMDIVKVIEEKSPETLATYRQRLEEKLRDLLENNTFDEQRILTETAIFADKIAIDEEIVRLRSHFVQLNTLLDGEEAVGRKLDFLLQEMNREINTIGSKSVNSSIAHLVVDVKAELEKIREQIQNIE